MTNSIITSQPKNIDDPNAIFTNEGLKQALRVCQHFLASGSLPSSYKNAQQVLMAIQLGRELGMKPVESLNGLLIINGQIKLWGTALTGRLTRLGYKIKWGECTPEKAEVKIIDPDGEETGTEVYTIEDAKTAGLLGKQNWRGHAKTMLRWRALSNCVKFNFPHVLQGVQVVEDDDNLNSTQEEQNQDLNSTQSHQTDNASKLLQKQEIENKQDDEIIEMASQEQLSEIEKLIDDTATKKEDVEKFYGKKIEDFEKKTAEEVIKMLKAKVKATSEPKKIKEEPKQEPPKDEGPLARAKRLAEEKKLQQLKEENDGIVPVPEEVAKYLNEIEGVEDVPEDIKELRKDVNAGKFKGIFHYPTLINKFKK